MPQVLAIGQISWTIARRAQSMGGLVTVAMEFLRTPLS